ncbi:hypothetical protein ABZ876_16930 [Streptomyces sp. NPDC046931]|uniref:hypothetical protein n=1 Tax=Streptomyces sp. NPDC046931 TaxID=3154806 RepID=UPI0033E25E9E
MNRLELGLALAIAYALGRRSGRPRQPLAARTPAVAHDPAVQRLKAEAWAYVMVRAQPLFAALGRRLGGLSVRLDDIVDGNSPGFARLALAVGRHVTRAGGPAHPLDKDTWGDEEDMDADADVADAAALVSAALEEAGLEAADLEDAEFPEEAEFPEDAEYLEDAEYDEFEDVDPERAEFEDEDDEGPEKGGRS